MFHSLKSVMLRAERKIFESLSRVKIMKLRVAILVLPIIVVSIACCSQEGHLRDNVAGRTGTFSSVKPDHTTTIASVTTTISKSHDVAKTTTTITPTTTTSVPREYSANRELDIPPNTEYEWIDLSNGLKTVTIEGRTYRTGLLVKAYVPKVIEPGKVYPILRCLF